MSATSTVPTATATAQTFEIRPFPGSVGAEIIGLDLSRPVNDQDLARIHRAHLDHHVVVFRDQRITPNNTSPSAVALACCKSTCSNSSCWLTTRKS